jgi:hypothetical protein
MPHHVHDQYTAKPDGALGVADSGQTWEQAYTNASSQLRILGGRLTNIVTSGASTAGYIDTPLSGPVKRIGGRFTYGAGSTGDGAATFVIWRTSITSFPTIPDTPFHLVVWPTGWDLTVIVGGVFSSSIASGTLSLANDGVTVHSCAVVIDGSTARITINGTLVATVTDSRFAVPGVYAGFEVFANAPATASRPQFVQVWASDTDGPAPVVEIDFASDLAAGLSYGEQIMAAGPYAYYPLREASGTVAVDGSGNGRNGTYAGSVTLNQTAGNPVTGEAAARYVTFGAGGRVGLTGVVPPGDRFAVEAWVYMASLASEGRIFDNGGTASGGSILRVWVGTDGKLHAQAGSKGVAGETNSSPAVIAATTWYHVTYVFDGPNQAGQFYVNGAPVATTAETGALSPSAWSLANVLTAWTFGSATNPVSRIASPAVYIETLDASRVADHYAAAANAVFPGYVWTDVTPYVLAGEGIGRRFGRDQQLSDVTPMTTTYTLLGDDRRFEPDYEGDNLVADGSFESGTLAKWTQPIGVAGTAAVAAHATDYVHKATFNVNGWRAVSSSTGSVQLESLDAIPVNPALPYTLSGYFRSVAGSATPQSALRLNCYDAAGALLGFIFPNQSASGVTYGGGHFNPSGTFARFGGTYNGQTGTAGGNTGGFIAGTASVRVQLWLQFTAGTFGSTTSVAADAVKLEQGVAATAYTSAPYWPKIEAGRPTRVRAMGDAGIVDWSFGFVQDWPQDWDDAVRSCRVPIVATCFLERLNQENIGARSFASQRSGGRITALANAAGVPTSLRRIDAGAYTLAAGVYDSVTVGDHARQVARTDRGLFFFDQSGNATFQDGTYRGNAVGNPSAATATTGWFPAFTGAGSGLAISRVTNDGTPAGYTALEVTGTPTTVLPWVILYPDVGVNVRRVSPGDVVRATAWVRAVSGTTSFRMVSFVYDAAGGVIAQDVLVTSTATGYVQMSAPYTVPAGAAYLGVQFQFIGTFGVAITGHVNGVTLQPERSATARGTLGSQAGEIQYRAPEFHAPLSNVKNDIRLRKPGGVDQPAADAASQRQRGTRSYTDELLLDDDAAIAARAAELLARYKDPQFRIRAVTFNPAAGGYWAHALGVNISDRYLWAFRPVTAAGAANGAPLARYAYVEGVTDSWRGGEYLSTWFLSTV